MTKAFRAIVVLAGLSAVACEPDESSFTPAPGIDVHYSLSTDKAAYVPGEAVRFNIRPELGETAQVRVTHLGSTVDELTVTGTSFTWSPPADDFKGYLMELYRRDSDGEEKVLVTIAVDVSSTWTRFPRYGFLSKFPQMSDGDIASVIDNLNRHHINGLQFYDWHYKHHQPLAGTVANPTPVYRDIINREIHLSTVSRYIDAAHARNIRAMFYNLVNGALKDAASNGVGDDMYLYTDASRTKKDKHPLSSPFISDIFLTDPSNTEWQQYLINEHRKVYESLDFDGYHMDQLGDRGTLYNYGGTTVSLPNSFRSFVEAIKESDPTKFNVMNAVNQFGQAEIAGAPVDFLYTEVWGPNDTYADLASIIQANDEMSEGRLRSVLAAYVNYDKADNPGQFNTPSVLMANAVIFAFGGAHLELGEHMLGKEYFPNSNLSMTEELKRRLVYYYDFLTAYQNVLRDGGEFNAPALVSHDNKVQFTNWPPQPGRVAVVGKKMTNRQVLHLINFNQAATMAWRDNNGVQPAPRALESLQIRFTPEMPVSKVWVASPDYKMGAPRSLEFKSTGNQITFTLPALEYWSMIVVEY